MTKLLLINEKSGSANALGVKNCIDAVEAAWPTSEIQLEVADGDPSSLVARASEFVDTQTEAEIALIAGDGTAAAVAGALRGSEAALAPLPGGTMNAFSRDLGYNADLLTAIGQLQGAKAVRVDIGMANDRAFLNNVVFGAYAVIASSRERLRDVDHIVEKADAVGEMVGALAHADVERYRLRIAGAEKVVVTNTIMAANNCYDGAGLLLPTRSRLDSGRLGLYVGKAKTPLDFLGILLDAFTANLPESDLIELYQCPSVEVSTDAGLLDATIDGESIETASPMMIRIIPKALKALAPGD